MHERAALLAPAGGRQLRDVAPFEATRQLAATIEGLPAPKRLKLAALGAVPAAQPVLATIPATSLQAGPLTPGLGGAAPGAGAGQPGADPQAQQVQQQLREAQLPKPATKVDPWLLLPGAATGVAEGQQFKAAAGGGRGALPPQWLQGAVRVRKRDLSYGFSSG